ncbi:alanyl-tRNA editing protein [Denitrobaculum tricleocarpae]|uniref:Alanine--tRNA ligase n=1 Tax=Denitrobaculum tricleocarpae TaxID=2591009 RepID=A0A545TQE8_9PROT|nr:alanyl-tRNA editing protein [Denitrobaculum tricleocarpae]TQV79341.1 alanyl-tRNA editing protein [Denitrobaculum tricleocarpae]
MELLFRDDAYLKDCEATVVSIGEEGLRLDRTVFYPMGGGQPGDTGALTMESGEKIRVLDTRKGENHEDVVHVLDPEATPPAVGSRVTAEIDWDRRYRLMRMHSCLHLLCAAVTGDVTGGQIGEEKSRLDFNLPDTQLDKEALTAELNRLISENHPVAERWISDEELSANPDLVRTMSVKPPSGSGKVRLLDIAGVDLQPCGGTHVRETGEIGRVRIGKIENKGRQNRRINIHFDG